jgi:hypothetical protein
MAKVPALVIAALIAVSTSLLAQPAAAEEAAHRPGTQDASLAAVPGNDRPAALSDIPWIAGSWLLEREGERLEEYWGPPLGDSMVGHFRWIRDGALWITELLSITEEDDTLVFRLRHFSSRMRSWESPEDPFEYRLTKLGEGRATFSMVEPRAGRPHRFIFERAGEVGLTVRIEGEEAGRSTSDEFRYQRSR